MITMRWKNFRLMYPAQALLLEEEYYGFGHGSFAACEFIVRDVETVRGDLYTITATDPAFPDPWFWCPAKGKWVS